MKTLARDGILARMMSGQAADHSEEKTAMIDATDPKTHQAVTSMGTPKGARAPDRSKFKDQETVWGRHEDRAPDRSAMISARGRCSAACQRSNGVLAITVGMLTAYTTFEIGELR